MTDPRLRRVALLVAACFFLELLDGTIVITAIPVIGRSLGQPPGAAALIVTAYLVTVAALIPVSGWLTLRWGYRRVLLGAIAIFTLASLGCAASPGFRTLVIMRVLQGAGGAMMVPVGRMVVFEQAPKSEVMRLMSYIVWPALLAPVLAPIAGGAIVTYASWRWLFLINVPLGAVGLVAGWRLVHGRPQQSRPRLDRAGVLLLCGGLAAVTYAAHLIAGQHPRWPWVGSLGLVASLLLAAAWRHLKRCHEPLIDLQTLRVRTFANAIAGSSLLWLVIGAIPFLLPLLFQSVFGWTPLKSGALVLFVFAGNIAIKPATSSLLARFGFRRVIVAATICLGLTAVGCALLTATTPLALIATLALISGAARSVAMTGYTTLTLSDIPSRQMRTANALAATTQQLFTGLAVVLSTVMLRLGQLVAARLGVTDASRFSYAFAFGALSAVAAAALVVVLRLDAADGEPLIARPANKRPATRV